MLGMLKTIVTLSDYLEVFTELKDTAALMAMVYYSSRMQVKIVNRKGTWNKF